MYLRKLKIERRARFVFCCWAREKEHQAYFANKINIYMKTRKVVAKIANEREKERERRKRRFSERNTTQNTSTHTQIYEMRIGERETGITVIRTVSSAYVE